MIHDTWYMIYDMSYMIYDMWYMILDIRYWYMVYDIWYEIWYIYIYIISYMVHGISYMVYRIWYDMTWYYIIYMNLYVVQDIQVCQCTHIYIHNTVYHCTMCDVLYSVWNNVAAAFTKIWRWRFCEALNITPRLCGRASSWTSLACRCRESLSTCTNRPLSMSHMRHI